LLKNIFVLLKIEERRYDFFFIFCLNGTTKKLNLKLYSDQG